MNEEYITIDTLDSAKGIKPTYEPYKLIDEKDPILKRKTELFVFNGEIDTKDLSNRLIQTLKNHGAYGIAAPQCGLPYRVLVIGTEDNYLTIFNPEIVEMSEDSGILEEGCLSFPFMILNIIRPNSIKIVYRDENNIEKHLTLSGLTCRVFLHEYDHLNGITFDKRAKPLALKNGIKKREKQIKRFARELINNNYMKKV